MQKQWELQTLLAAAAGLRRHQKKEEDHKSRKQEQARFREAGMMMIEAAEAGS